MTLPIVKWRSSLAHSSDQMLNRRVILNLSPEVENSQNRLEFMTSFIKNSIETEKMENNKMVKWEMLNAKWVHFWDNLLKMYCKIEFIYKMKIPVYGL